MTLLDELKKFPDIDPKPMSGGGVEQPWCCPIYGASAEIELIDFLYCFVKLIRPALIVELGCHLGLTSWGLGRAAEEIGSKVVTCDIEENYANITRNRCEGLPVTVHWQNAGWLPEIKEADFLFIDCDYENRKKAIGLMKPGAVGVVHDTRQEPDLRMPLDPLEQKVHFDTWRGFSILRKT